MGRASLEVQINANNASHAPLQYCIHWTSAGGCLPLVLLAALCVTWLVWLCDIHNGKHCQRREGGTPSRVGVAQCTPNATQKLRWHGAQSMTAAHGKQTRRPWTSQRTPTLSDRRPHGGEKRKTPPKVHVRLSHALTMSTHMLPGTHMHIYHKYTAYAKKCLNETAFLTVSPISVILLVESFCFTQSICSKFIMTFNK